MRVVEYGDFLAVPLLGRYLVDIGWEVRSFTQPSGNKYPHCAEDAARIHDALQRGKSLACDLHTELQEANVLIENVGADALGMTKHAISTRYPHLIHVSLPGYASEDEEHAGFCDHEASILAASGVFSDMGVNRTLLGIRASFTHLPLASVYGSIFGLCALMSAVVEGRMGSYIEVPLASALLEALVHNSIVFPIDVKYMNRRKQTLLWGQIPVDMDTLDSLFDPFFTFYDCRDARKMYLVCPAHRRHQLSAIDVLGVRQQVLSVIEVVDTYDEREVTGIGSGNLNAEQSRSVRSILRDAFLTRTAREWEIAFGHQRVPAIMVRSTQEWMRCAHARDSGLVDEGGVPGPLVWTHVVTRDDTLKRDATNLSATRIIDATNVIAGPTVTAMLARFGCEVIKVDPVRPTYAPDITVVYGLSANVGKRSILLDVQTREGRDAFLALLKTADVLAVNTTRTGLERMGLPLRDIATIHPTLIVLRFDAWGGILEQGAFSEWLGYDDNIQAATGIMVRYGGGYDTPEEHAHVGTIDVIAGVAGAAATLVAIHRRDREGCVCEARTSLAAVSQYVQYPFFIVGEPQHIGRGLACRGVTPFYSVYPTADGHVVLTGRPDASSLPIIDTTSEEIERFMLSHSTVDVQVMLRDSSLRVTPLRTTSDLRNSYVRDAPCLSSKHTYQYIEYNDHPVGRVVMVSPVAMRVPIRSHSGIAPKYGVDTFDVLNGIRMTHVLRTFGIVPSYSRSYLPRIPRCDGCGEQGETLSVLDCSHQLCRACIMNTCGITCPCCGREGHVLGVLWRKLWRRAYSTWRQGGSSGSVTRCATTSCGVRRTKSSPMLLVNHEDAAIPTQRPPHPHVVGREERSPPSVAYTRRTVWHILTR